MSKLEDAERDLLEEKIKGYLKEAKDACLTQSTKASDLLRKIATGLMAVLWSSFFLKETRINTCVVLSLVFVALYFTLDVWQYFRTSNKYSNAHKELRVVKTNVSDADAVKKYESSASSISKWATFFYTAKLIALFVAIILFAIFLFSTYPHKTTSATKQETTLQQTAT